MCPVGARVIFRGCAVYPWRARPAKDRRRIRSIRDFLVHLGFVVDELRVSTQPPALLAAHLMGEWIRIIDQGEEERNVLALGIGLIVDLDGPYLDQ